MIRIIAGETRSEAEKYNFAAAQTNGKILCFVDPNLKPLSKDWLKEMASFAFQKEIGAVGAKLLYADKSILHGGLVVGMNGLVGIAHHCLPQDDNGNIARTQVINNFSAVSISCFATRRETFQSVGGFDAENLPNKFFDADFCLKLRERNYRIVFTPYAALIQIDEKKRLNLQKIPTAAEKNYFARKWKKFVERDPFYNLNLSKKAADFSINV
ncbi:MAG: hypothetical protein LC778_14990 [Acidobacteria bacterium]|nr:hypothetical protein [Acidobacteriota bacterium]